MSAITNVKAGTSVTVTKVYNPTERKPRCASIHPLTKERCSHLADGVLRFDDTGVEVAICQECFDTKMKEHRLN
jgi:hypothetical protein